MRFSFTLLVLSFSLLYFYCSKDNNPAAPGESSQTDYFKSLSPLPDPPDGFEWKVDMRFSDDFDGTELDRTKWHDHHPYWDGRPPAKFMPEAVSVKDGTLQLTCGILHKRIGDFTMQGGAVVSKSEAAGFGYYEARFKATKISMSSTFWLTNQGGNTLPKLSGELDIVETIGGAKRWPSFATQMKSNTHINYTDASGEQTIKSVGGHTDLDGKSGDDFYTYGAWWVDENTIHFYYNGDYRYTIHPDTTLVSKPMQPGKYVNLVSETYDWEYPPTGLELQNDEINTTYYEWVRAFTLKPKE